MDRMWVCKDQFRRDNSLLVSSKQIDEQITCEYSINLPTRMDEHFACVDRSGDYSVFI
jgi:hypothetical protein